MGCAFALRLPGKPNAHLSFNRGTSAAVKPAAPLQRVLEVVTPQPFHGAPSNGLLKAAGAPAHMALAEGVVSNGCAKDFPVTNSASERRSAGVRRLAIEVIAPPSRAASTRSGCIRRRVSRVGARFVPVS